MRESQLIIGLVVVSALLAAMPASAQGVLFVTGGKVGIGTNTPDGNLHILSGGATSFRLENTAASKEWSFANGAGGNFAVNLIGSGGNEVTVRGRNDAGGNPTMTVDGSIQATNVTFSSSRQLKTDFAAVDGERVLERLAALPVMSWSFKDGAGERHVGPIAEDFHEVFQLGSSSRTISMIDAGGVAFAAIQGLNSRLEKKDERIAALEKEVEELRALVATVVERSR